MVLPFEARSDLGNAGRIDRCCARGTFTVEVTARRLGDARAKPCANSTRSSTTSKSADDVATPMEGRRALLVGEVTGGRGSTAGHGGVSRLHHRPRLRQPPPRDEHLPARLSADVSPRNDGHEQSVATVPVVPPAALRRMHPGDALLIHGTLAPAQVRLRPWYGDRCLRSRAKPNDF